MAVEAVVVVSVCAWSGGAYHMQGQAQVVQEGEGHCHYGVTAAVVWAAAAAAYAEGEDGGDGPLHHHQEAHHQAGDSWPPS